jgi:ATP-dependent DNA helicase 2 subunit 1
MLIPQERSTDECEDKRHDGFRVEFVPYAADIRNLEKLIKPDVAVEESEIELMRKMIRKIRLNYNPKLFENPSLKTLYKNIEGIVFGSTDLDDFDVTVPDLEYQDRKIGAIVENINEVFGKVSERTLVYV